MDQFTNLLRNLRGDASGEMSLLEAVALASRRTDSRNGLLALLDGEEGVLDIKAGCGPDWTQDLASESLDVTTRSGIVGYVAATGKSFLTDDVNTERRYVQLYESTVSEAAVPIFDLYGRVVGVLNVESDRKANYSEDDLAALEMCAEACALVLDRQESAARERALIEIASSLDHARTEEELLSAVVRIAREVLRFQAFGVFLLEKGAGYVLRAGHGRLMDRMGEIRYAPGEGIIGAVASSGQPWVGDDPAADPNWIVQNNELPDSEISSYMAVPAMSRGKCLAVLRLIRRKPANKHLDNRFTETDVTLLTAIAEQMASGLDSIRSLTRLLRSERMAAWGESSAKSSHMIGNRVFALRGEVNELGHLLDDKVLDRDALRDIHKGLNSGVERLSEILHDFRDFLTATQLNPEPADLNEVVREAVEEVFPSRSTVRLQFDLAPKQLTVKIDRQRSKRAFSEMIENSLGFFDKGDLTVRTGLATSDQVQRSKLSPREAYACVEFEDHGPGVAQERKEEIFEPFFTGRVKGMGLGLSIVRGIVEAHGGAVYEDGVPGDGARFVILLPLLNRS